MLSLLSAGWQTANAAEPTISECLTASDASFKFATEEKLRAERKQLLVCSAANCPREVRKECLRRVEELNVAIPTVVFEVKDSEGSDIADVKVWMDSELLSERLGGRALEVDPGEHTFRFESRGRKRVEKRLLIRESEKERRERVVLPVTDAAEPADGNRSRASKLGVRKVSAIAVGSLGIVGVGVGTVFGIETLTRKHTAETTCPGQQCATREGVNQWSDAKAAGNVATVAFIAGGAALAGAAVLWFADTSSKESVQVAMGAGSLQVKGTW